MLSESQNPFNSPECQVGGWMVVYHCDCYWLLMWWCCMHGSSFYRESSCQHLEENSHWEITSCYFNYIYCSTITVTYVVERKNVWKITLRRQHTHTHTHTCTHAGERIQQWKVSCLQKYNQILCSIVHFFALFHTHTHTRARAHTHTHNVRKEVMRKCRTYVDPSLDFTPPLLSKLFY